MKYVPPYGTTDPNAGYINGNPAQGLKGSIPPAAVFQNPQTEIVNMISKSHFVPTDADLLQLTEAIRSQYINTVVDTGSVNVLSVACDPPLQSYTRGLLLRVLVYNTNTDQCTIDAGCGRVNVHRTSGAALAPGDLVAGGLYDMGYDGTSFQLINFLGTGTIGDVHNYYINIPYVVDTSPTANIITANFSPAITSLSAGQAILVKINNNNVAATKINVNTLTPVSVKCLDDGLDLLPDDIVKNGIYLMVFDGTTFYLKPTNIIVSNVTLNVPSTQFNTPTALLNVLERKIIGPTGFVIIQLGAGIFAPFAVNHPSANGIQIKGTMIGAAPTSGNFSASGTSAASRAADAAFNLSMLRARYGTEIQVPPSGGIGIHVGHGTLPGLVDLLITTGNSPSTGPQTFGVYDNSVSCQNVSVWGCRGGFVANPNGNIGCFGCFASSCYFGFMAEHGGSFGMQNNGSQDNGAFGCDNAGFTAQAGSYMLLNTVTSKGNGYYGFACTDMSTMVTANVVINTNGSQDIIAVNMSEINISGGSLGYTSPAPNTFGNNGSLFVYH
jgi:hypothetical protein